MLRKSRLATNAALRWAVRDESLREAYCDSVEQAQLASHLASSDLPMDDWYGSVIGIIHEVASHHFGTTTLSLDDSSSVE